MIEPTISAGLKQEPNAMDAFAAAVEKRLHERDYLHAESPQWVEPDIYGATLDIARALAGNLSEEARQAVIKSLCPDGGGFIEPDIILRFQEGYLWPILERWNAKNRGVAYVCRECYKTVWAFRIADLDIGADGVITWDIVHCATGDRTSWKTAAGRGGLFYWYNREGLWKQALGTCQFGLYQQTRGGVRQAIRKHFGHECEKW